MSEWRTYKTLRTDRDDCGLCAHSTVEPQKGADNLLCREPGVLASFERERVSAQLARGVQCAGKHWRAR